MVIFTLPTGQRIGINPDLIETALCRGTDTVIRLVDGRQHSVTENLDEVAERLLAHRTAIVDGQVAPAPSQGQRVLQLIR
jgi:uncharacterized protein YlzI (FlbEa/FlbD family)